MNVNDAVKETGLTREDILNSTLLLKRFCKDQNVPISVYSSPYFITRLQVFDRARPGLTEKFDEFCRGLSEYKNEQDYFEYYNSVKEAVIEDIKSSQGFHALQEAIMSWKDGICRIGELVFPSEPWEASCRKNLYSETNDGKRFVSIDMKKANFTAVRTFDRSLFGTAKTWEEYLSEFTKQKHIIDSKYIRQVVFGACNPKRQVTLEQWLMLNVLYCLKKELPDVPVFSLTGDEIVLEDTGLDVEEVKAAVEKSVVGGSLEVEPFLLEKIPDTDGYIRRHDDGSVVFKGINSETGHLIIKYYYGIEPEEYDNVFWHNGRLARFIESLPDPWNGTAPGR